MTEAQSTSIPAPKPKCHDLLNDKLSGYTKAANELYDIVEPLAHGAKSEPLNDMIDMYLKLEYIKDACEALVKACNIHQPEIADLVAKEMIASGTESVTRSGRTISPDTKLYVSVTKENKPLVVQWLKTQMGGRELVSEDYNANALTSYIGKLIDVEGYAKDSEDPEKRLPPMISTFDKPILSIRKKKAK